MKSNAALIVALIALVLIVGPIAIGYMTESMSNAFKGLNDWIKYGWDNNQSENGTGNTNGQTNEGQGNNQTTPSPKTDGYSSIGIKIYFKDGSVQDLEPDQVSFYIFPLSVYVGGKEIDHIEFALWAKATWTGTLTNLKISGTLRVRADPSTANEVTLRSEGMLKNYASLQQDTWFEVWKFSLRSEDISYSLSDGDHQLLTQADPCTFTATYSDATTKTITLTGNDAPNSSMTVKVQKGGTLAIYAEVRTTPFYK
ncbi:MAG: hypothetical protein QXZ70_01095 [Candidatus Bathyarchaeia archaeon]